MAATAPNSVEEELPEFVEALAHVRACAECQLHQAAIRTTDLRLGVAIRSVPTPLGLKSRLLAKLAETTKLSETIASSDPGSKQISSSQSGSSDRASSEAVLLGFNVPVLNSPVELQVSELPTALQTPAQLQNPGDSHIRRDSTVDPLTTVNPINGEISKVTSRLINRRRVLAAISTAAMAMIGVGFWWFWDRQQPTDLTVNALLALCQELAESASQSAIDSDPVEENQGKVNQGEANQGRTGAKLVAFQRTFEPRLPYSEIQIPRSLLTQQGISLQAANIRVVQSSELQSVSTSRQSPSREPAKNNSVPKGPVRSAIASTEIGVMYRFSVRDATGKSSSGVMVVVNLDRVDVRDLDVLASSFASAEVYYPAPNLYATRIWRRDQQLYVCYVESHERNLLDSLMRQFYST